MPYDRSNSGTIGPNFRKTRDKHPDYSGSCEVGGVQYWISGWAKHSDRGPFVSLAFKPKDQQVQQPQRQAPAGGMPGLDLPPQQRPAPEYDEPMPGGEDIPF